MNIPATVSKILDVAQLTQSQFAGKVGVSQGTVSKWINEGHSPNTDQWQRVVQFASRYPDLRDLVKGLYLAGGVPVMGYIGTGAEITPEFEQVPPEGLEQIDLPFDVSSEIIAFRVKGSSMRPAYRDGDVVLVHANQKGAPDSYFGEEVAVRTLTGNRYLKEIHPGERKGTFNLVSHNAEVIKNVRLEWVGEIYLTIRNNQVRKIAHKAAREAVTAPRT